MIVIYRDEWISLANNSKVSVKGDTITFRQVDGYSDVLVFESDVMAQRSSRMIRRHLSRGRSTCDLDLLGKYDELGWVVIVTQVIRRTINRVAGRWGL